jgi:lipoic acid synthetase
VAALGLKHAVITSVTRDDLPDGGASVFAATVLAIRRRSPGITVEVLVPDFKACPQAVQAVLDVRPDVFNHNLETVPRLYPHVRAGASYRGSIELLELVAQADRGIVTKSGIMLGVGETFSEVVDLIRDLAQIGLMVLTVGQYLRPSSAHLPVHRYVPPEEFERLRDMALAAGIGWVESGPLVRSSYHAETIMADLKHNRAFEISTNLIAERSESG